jgi:hypothetical protein
MMLFAIDAYHGFNCPLFNAEVHAASLIIVNSILNLATAFTA